VAVDVQQNGQQIAPFFPVLGNDVAHRRLIGGF